MHENEMQKQQQLESFRHAPLHLLSVKTCSPQIFVDGLDHYWLHCTSCYHPLANSLDNVGNIPNHQDCRMKEKTLENGKS